MARLNKLQIYSIRWLNYQNMTNEKIAEELSLNIDQVNKTIEKYTKSSESPGINTKTEPAANNLMITKTSGKGNNGVAIMTKEASFKNDSLRSKTTNKATNQSIFRPKKNG